MSITPSARARIHAIAPDLVRLPASEIARALKGAAGSPLTGHLSLPGEKTFTAAYAPFDWINDRADIILLGVTPGLRQATDSLVTLRDELAAGASIEKAAESAKASASFKGMRDLASKLMDSLGLDQVFGVASCKELFEAQAHRVHSTSVLRYPVFKKGKNFSGDKRIMKRPMMRAMVEEYLVPELASLPGTWVVPFGSSALAVLDDLSERGLIDPERVLGGVLHPGGQQWNRYKVQLGITTGAAARAVPGGAEIMERSADLRSKAAGLASRRMAA